MAIPLAAMFAGSSLLSFLGNMFSQNAQKQMLKKLQGPNADDFMLSAAEKSKIKSNMYGDLMGGHALTQKNIKQAGAAKNLPSGAIGSQLAASDMALGRGAARIEGDMARMDASGRRDYALTKNQFDMDKTGAMINMANMSNMNNQGYLGNLTKMLMLWQYGAFNQPGGGAMSAGGSTAGMGIQNPYAQWGGYGVPDFNARGF